MFITGAILELEVHLPFDCLEIFGALVDIEHRGHVVLSENIENVVSDQGCFSDGCVTHEHQFELNRAFGRWARIWSRYWGWIWLEGW